MGLSWASKADLYVMYNRSANDLVKSFSMNSKLFTFYSSLRTFVTSINKKFEYDITTTNLQFIMIKYAYIKYENCPNNYSFVIHHTHTQLH